MISVNNDRWFWNIPKIIETIGLFDMASVDNDKWYMNELLNNSVLL